MLKKQLTCNHDWYDPCMDPIDRYNKCTKCYCLQYDCTWEEYLERSIEYENRPKLNEIIYLLERIVGDLPLNRDWLDPEIEKTAKSIIEEYA